MVYNFFIDRPIFANVIALVTMLLGGVALFVLPVQQFPDITPPTVRVNALYPGANAEVVANTVAGPLEEEINGVEHMLYMSSTSSSDGSYTLEVTFDIGTNLNEAQTQVQNRISRAEPQLPEPVRRQGLTARKQSTNLTLVISLVSSEEDIDSLFLANYARLRIRDELSRISGVGQVTVFGSNEYAMRIWLNPEKLAARRLSVQDVLAAIQNQNAQVAAGQIGQPPTTEGQQFQYTVTARGRLSEVEQFENIVVKATEDGRNLRLKDVGRVELGSQSYAQFTEKEGQPNANIGVYQLPGANALEVADKVKQRMDELGKAFPEGIAYSIPLDTTKFVDESIHEVYMTLLEAGILVLLVIVVFLQDWRAVLVPATTVPVTIVGAFAGMYLLGFSINTLTMFGLVLSIGIVVDDAIVVVENAAHHVERGMDSREATKLAMRQVFGPVIATSVVLIAVFLPASFLGGITGQFYRQFALTIAATAVLSAVNAVTLKPAQCALSLRPPPEKRNIFARGFNFVYGRIERAYAWSVKRILKIKWAMMLIFLVLLGGAGWWYLWLPTGLLPTEDQGYIFISVQLPDAASQQRTRKVMNRVNNILADVEGVDNWINIGGLSLADRSTASNVGTIFVTLTPWNERTQQELALESILGTLQQQFGQIQEARVVAFPPPSIRGVGVRGGFQMEIQDRAQMGMVALGQQVEQIIAEAETRNELTNVTTSFRGGVPQIRAEIDRVKVTSHNLNLADVFVTLQSYIGEAYVNDFNKFGRTYQVRVQAEKTFRDQPQDIRRLQVRNREGEMVPLGAVVRLERSYGPQVITRYNTYPSASVSGRAAGGYSSGDAMRTMEQLAERELPPSMGYEWTGMALQEKKVGNQVLIVFALAVSLVYLALAAQYESWFLPLAVILVVPLGLLGAVAAVNLRGTTNNIYTQVGIVLIIALASKNAILIVEFARDLHRDGEDILTAAVNAARMRFRPILMTSFSFILGVVPLVIAEGAGAAGQQAMGTAVVGGMIAATLLAIFFVPVFYVLCQRLDDWTRSNRSQERERTETSRTVDER